MQLTYPEKQAFAQGWGAIKERPRNEIFGVLASRKMGRHFSRRQNTENLVPRSLPTETLATKPKLISYDSLRRNLERGTSSKAGSSPSFRATKIHRKHRLLGL